MMVAPLLAPANPALASAVGVVGQGAASYSRLRDRLGQASGHYGHERVVPGELARDVAPESGHGHVRELGHVHQHVLRAGTFVGSKRGTICFWERRDILNRAILLECTYDAEESATALQDAMNLTTWLGQG